MGQFWDSSKQQVATSMQNLRAAKKLGVTHEEIELFYSSSDRKWKDISGLKLVNIESAALEMFTRQGWKGYSAEGGLILNVIKAASFKALSRRNRRTYIEALYAQNVAFDQDRYEAAQLIQSIRDSDLEQIKRNIRVMFDDTQETEIYDAGSITITSTSGGSIKDFFPELCPEVMADFYLHIGREKLAQIAEIFSKDPYEYRKGWPDLTLWKHETKQVIFREVKAPGDKIRPSQKKVIEDILLPLGCDVGIIDIKVSECTNVK